ncbi:hypothetical protein [Pseudobacter ginsenosidimutans]|uniref:hypothetical protein n=1 Tax=Pseudobacter ginsenosidimutans TaxID=661488 RepID=UPI00102D89AD|nr:hypothetical protein [Pseudobacter ginsenosidimutans]QEC43309.1 hypothetical protein FSB84_16985 [Pseudobacter ginsenosidimutans]
MNRAAAFSFYIIGYDYFFSDLAIKFQYCHAGEAKAFTLAGPAFSAMVQLALSMALNILSKKPGNLFVEIKNIPIFAPR